MRVGSPPGPILPVLRRLICELLACRRKFSELVSNHFFGYGDVEIVLPIVNLEFQANEVWQDRRRASLGLNGHNLHACFRPDDWEGNDVRPFPYRSAPERPC